MDLLVLFLNELVYKYLRMFSVLISNMATTNWYDLHKQILFEVLNNFQEYKGVLKPRFWELLLYSNLSHWLLSQICYTNVWSCSSIE